MKSGFYWNLVVLLSSRTLIFYRLSLPLFIPPVRALLYITAQYSVKISVTNKNLISCCYLLHNSQKTLIISLIRANILCFETDYGRLSGKFAPVATIRISMIFAKFAVLLTSSCCCKNEFKTSEAIVSTRYTHLCVFCYRPCYFELCFL